MNIKIIFKLFLIVFLNVILFGCTTQNEKVNECMKTVEGTIHHSVYAKFCQEINPFFDFDDALLAAQQDNKPMLVYFNSIACVNCRTFEDKVFLNLEIVKHLSKKFTTVVLFADDKRPIKQEDDIISPLNGKKIKDFGAYNSHLQVLLTKSGWQPYVCVFNLNKEPLASYQGSLISTEEFEDWLTEIEDIMNSQ